ncbi:helix-turn-helix domain-containing protein [Priestia flexa]|uniref:helix-turn-helix domain-containing protein n=1 Tax=Ferrimonas balearica TaxID=44012 RepID=UPI003AEF8106|nr:helix-turn-helix domain-containing protein [Ferrimonas balearica]
MKGQPHLGAQLRAFRLSKGLKQEYVAMVAGVSQGAYSRAERSPNPHPKYFGAVGAALVVVDAGGKQ